MSNAKANAYRRLTWPLFFELIRLPAKLCSFLPYLFGILYAWWGFHQFNWVNSLIYFIGQMSIALFVTGFNNVQDFYKAKDEHYRQTQNIIGREHLSPRRILALMGLFLAIAVGAGVLLVWRTDLSLLLIGGLAIFVAIFYTFGPVPLSRIPSGELLSGTVEGFGAVFIAVFVNVVPQPITLTLTGSRFALSGNLPVVLALFLLALPIVILDGTVMFADNICDLAQDQRNQRFTLPYYLGKARALRIYPWLPAAAFLAIVLAVGLRLLPWPVLLVVFMWPQVRRNIDRFLAVQDKAKTFNTAVNNLLMTFGSEAILLLACILADLAVPGLF
ncbi:UbiA family prenyltransferase [Lacticaseibacillus jixianensis]|uniref:UbiA family prenyltransferase n=1 Tax=Lacticaseibacillus jixianensis TaxID=2486012 RepID=A0ABW4B9P7_9LACO|nr:UbiA family prenyltransferase [Lacticaseibacillus jixianensis]